MNIVKLALLLLLSWASVSIYSQEAKSNRVEFMLYNLTDSLPPVIKILKPDLMDDMSLQTNKEEVYFIGEVKDESHIKFVAINSEKITIDESGVFTSRIALYPGKNEIRLVASDLYNNLREKFIIIEYSPSFVSSAVKPGEQ